MEIVGDTSSHLRSIGDQFYMTNQNIVDGKVQDLTEAEIADFKNNWKINYSRNLGQRKLLHAQRQFKGQKISKGFFLKLHCPKSKGNLFKDFCPSL